MVPVNTLRQAVGLGFVALLLGGDVWSQSLEEEQRRAAFAAELRQNAPWDIIKYEDHVRDSRYVVARRTAIENDTNLSITCRNETYLWIRFSHKDLWPSSFGMEKYYIVFRFDEGEPVHETWRGGLGQVEVKDDDAMLESMRRSNRLLIALPALHGEIQATFEMKGLEDALGKLPASCFSSPGNAGR